MGHHGARGGWPGLSWGDDLAAIFETYKIEVFQVVRAAGIDPYAILSRRLNGRDLLVWNALEAVARELQPRPPHDYE